MITVRSPSCSWAKKKGESLFFLGYCEWKRSHRGFFSLSKQRNLSFCFVGVSLLVLEAVAILDKVQTRDAFACAHWAVRRARRRRCKRKHWTPDALAKNLDCALVRRMLGCILSWRATQQDRNGDCCCAGLYAAVCFVRRSCRLSRRPRFLVARRHRRARGRRHVRSGIAIETETNKNVLIFCTRLEKSKHRP